MLLSPNKKNLRNAEELGKENPGWERVTEIYQRSKSCAYDLPLVTIFFLYMAFSGS